MYHGKDIDLPILVNVQKVESKPAFALLNSLAERPDSVHKILEAQPHIVAHLREIYVQYLRKDVTLNSEYRLEPLQDRVLSHHVVPYLKLACIFPQKFEIFHLMRLEHRHLKE